MNTAATQREQYKTFAPVLYLAFELGNTSWKLGFTTGMGQRPRERTIRARDLKALEAEIARARKRFGLPVAAAVVSCYEAGRDGFWLHRYLVKRGIRNHVVDSSSIEVKRRARRVKTDRLDVGKLLLMLLRYWGGEETVWSVVRVPREEEEDRRQLNRELETVKRDRTRATNRIKGLLAAQGIRLEVTGDFPAKLEAVRLWDGSLLPIGLRARLEREWEKVQLFKSQIRLLEGERRRALRTGRDPAVAMVRQLYGLRGIGENGSWLLSMEFFSWRQFRNRREVGGLAGLAPSPYQSGELSREGGIGKDGNRHVRKMAVELAWCWLRYQPESALSRWYEERFAGGGKRLRRIGIVALARKLLVELWKYLETGVLPEGALLKA